MFKAITIFELIQKDEERKWIQRIASKDENWKKLRSYQNIFNNGREVLKWIKIISIISILSKDIKWSLFAIRKNILNLNLSNFEDIIL